MSTSLWAAQRTGQEINAARKAYGRAIDNMRAAFPHRDLARTAGWMNDVVVALRGMGWMAWQELDERGGYRDLEDWRFALVRQTRNSPIYGPCLIEAVNEPHRLTLRYVRERLRDIGATINSAEGEYHVRLKTTPAGEGYFTTDLRDALDTGRAMARERDAKTIFTGALRAPGDTP